MVFGSVKHILYVYMGDLPEIFPKGQGNVICFQMCLQSSTASANQQLASEVQNQYQISTQCEAIQLTINNFIISSARCYNYG